jgi:eukaryotic-like serine/threonine-protein kinase
MASLGTVVPDLTEDLDQTETVEDVQEHAEETMLSGPRRAPLELSGFSHRPSAPRVIGQRYEVEGCLGEGGTAVVYLARDAVLERWVVVKVMKPEIAATPELKARFLFEAHALARVDHPSVVKILDISDVHEDYNEDAPPFLVLEALPGESLGEYLKRHDCMPQELALRLLREAAVALAAVHRAGLVHRDIKPDNIYLVGPIDAPTHVKVLDFGMAHVLDDGHDDDSTSILGTAQYMAPEQILVEPVDARTDVYGLGVVLFRAITGHLPFDDVVNKHQLLRHQLFSPVPPASWLHEHIAPGLERLIHRCTRKAPHARYAAMDEVVKAFDDAARPLHFEDDMPPSSHGGMLVSPFEFSAFNDPDVYPPVTSKGKKAAELLAVEFGIYSKPQRTWPSQG